jgi:hypothetical protein
MNPSYIFISIENVYTQNNLNKFTVCTHLREMRGNTQEMEGKIEKSLKISRKV